jgi:hypothetical protein
MSTTAKIAGTYGGGSSVISYSFAAVVAVVAASATPLATKERRPLARPVTDDARIPRLFSETISAKQYSSGAAARAWKEDLEILVEAGAFRGVNAQAWQTRQTRAKSDDAFIVCLVV